MKNNNHVQVIPKDILTQAQAKIDEAMEVLAPYLLSLTPTERRKIPKTGRKTINFVEKAYDFAKQTPTLVPAYLDIKTFGTDVEGSRSLWTLINSVRQLEQHLCDTEMSAGSEAYQAALKFYNFVKLAASQNLLGAKAVFQTLKTRFPQKGRQKSSETVPMPPSEETPQS